MTERRALQLGLILLIVVFVAFPVAKSPDGNPWPVTIALAAVIGTVGLIGAVILYRSPPAPPEPPVEDPPPPPKEG